MLQLLNPTNIAEELAKITEHWAPRVIGQVNDQYVKVAKVKGELVWHKHDHEDELFLVVYGKLVIRLEDTEDVTLEKGEFYIVPKGTMHNPLAEEECGLVLIESVSTKHTGDVESPLTKSIEDQLSS